MPGPFPPSVATVPSRMTLPTVGTVVFFFGVFGVLIVGGPVDVSFSTHFSAIETAWTLPRAVPV